MAWQPRTWAQGGNVTGERFAEGNEVDKDWLYTFKDRVKRVELLRELIARLSEKRLSGSRSSFKEGSKGVVAPKGLECDLGRLESVIEAYKKELDEVLRQQELVEKWLEDKTPRQKDLVRLRFMLGYSIRDAAEWLGRSTRYVDLMEKELFGK